MYAGDVAQASVVATRKGLAGERYLAFGRPGDVGGVPWFCNLALEVAGSDRRVTEVAVAELDDPDVAARFGPSLVALARKQFPSPFFVNDQTVERLGYEPLDPPRGLRTHHPLDARARPALTQRPGPQKGAIRSSLKQIATVWRWSEIANPTVECRECRRAAAGCGSHVMV